MTSMSMKRPAPTVPGDFFALTPVLLGRYPRLRSGGADSWIPEMRAAYVKHITDLTNPGTQTLLVTLEYHRNK